MGLVHKVQQTIEQTGLLRQGDTVVVAVSGGPDSTALLYVLHELSESWNLQLIIAHMNHQFRGEESEKEAERVSQMALELGWPCEIDAVNVPDYMRSHSLNAQVASREKRYAFLLQVAKQHKAGKIALAHHADDQAETVLMRLIRGSGLSGLSGIPLHREEGQVMIVRPFLYCYKTELLAYCMENKIDFSLDSSNQERKYTRNQVRLDMMPFLQKWNKQLPQSLNKLAAIIGEEDHFMTQETMKAFDNLVEHRDEAYIFSKMGFLSLPIALQRRLIKLILDYLCLKNDANDFVKVELMRQAIGQTLTPSMELHLSEQFAFTMEYDFVRIGQRQRPAGQALDYAYTVSSFPTTHYIPEAMAGITMHVGQMTDNHLSFIQNRDKSQALFDLEQVVLPLTIRNRRPGDRMKLAGLNGTKKVKDILIDEKIPPSRRQWLPIVVDAEDTLLWIPGIRDADHARIAEGTQRVLHMRCDDYIKY